MAKRLAAKTGEFQNQQGETKGEYARLGVVMQGTDGEFLLLDPTVSLAGVLVKQNALAMAQGKQVRDSVLVSIFNDDNQNQNQGQNNQQGYQQGNGQRPPQGQQRSSNTQQNGYQNNQDPNY